jgi:heme/copper-type cytochrome/quinol oxidase subunit 2
MEKITGKILLTVGIVLVVTGFLLLQGVKIPMGKLPGDIMIKKENFSFYFPFTTCILISIILTLLFTFIWRK